VCEPVSTKSLGIELSLPTAAHGLFQTLP